jgi:hypothetical protein
VKAYSHRFVSTHLVNKVKSERPGRLSNALRKVRLAVWVNKKWISSITSSGNSSRKWRRTRAPQVSNYFYGTWYPIVKNTLTGLKSVPLTH